MKKFIRSIVAVAAITLITVVPFAVYFFYDNNALILISGLVYAYIDVKAIALFSAVRKVDDTETSLLVAQDLRSDNPRKHLRRICNRHDIKTEPFQVYEDLKIDGVSAQLAVLLMKRLEWRDIAFILAVCISEIKELYTGWDKAVTGYQEEKKTAKSYEEAYKRLQKVQVTQLRKLGVQTTALDALQAEIDALKRKKPIVVKQPPAPINFNHENAVLEQKLVKLEAENKELHSKLRSLSLAAEESVPCVEEALPDLPEEGVLYVDGDVRRLSAVSLRHPKWVCVEPTYNMSVTNAGIKLVIVQKYRVKHKHTALITKQFPNALMYIVDKTNFEDDIKAKLYEG